MNISLARQIATSGRGFGQLKESVDDNSLVGFKDEGPVGGLGRWRTMSLEAV